MTFRLLSLAAVAAVLIPAWAGLAPARAEDEPVKVAPADADAFDARLFGNPAGATTAHACFTRRYDARHLAQHPKQKVATMKVLVSAQYPPPEGNSPYAFKLGFTYRTSKAVWSSMGDCAHLVDPETGHDVRMTCAVDCDGGGIAIGLSPDAAAITVSINRMRIWNDKDPTDNSHQLIGGDDDRLFKLERTNLRDCAPLIEDRDERLALSSR